MNGNPLDLMTQGQEPGGLISQITPPEDTFNYEDLYRSAREAGQRIPYAPDDPYEQDYLERWNTYRSEGPEYAKEGTPFTYGYGFEGDIIGKQQMDNGLTRTFFRDGTYEDIGSNESFMGNLLGNVAKYGSLGMLAFTSGGVLAPALGAIGGAAAGGAIGGGIGGGVTEEGLSGSGALKGAAMGAATAGALKGLGAPSVAGDVGVDYAMTTPGLDWTGGATDITGAAAAGGALGTAGGNDGGFLKGLVPSNSTLTKGLLLGSMSGLGGDGGEQVAQATPAQINLSGMEPMATPITQEPQNIPFDWKKYWKGVANGGTGGGGLARLLT